MSGLSILKNEINEFNCVITSLLIQTNYHELESFERVERMVEEFVGEWEGFVQRGNAFRFIEITDACSKLSDKDLYYLTKSIQQLTGYASTICAKIDGAEID